MYEVYGTYNTTLLECDNERRRRLLSQCIYNLQFSSINTLLPCALCRLCRFGKSASLPRWHQSPRAQQTVNLCNSCPDGVTNQPVLCTRISYHGPVDILPVLLCLCFCLDVFYFACRMTIVSTFLGASSTFCNLWRENFAGQ